MADDESIITKEGAKAELKKHIEFYNRNKDIYGKSPEQTIRQKLIDGLFEILGWDLRGKESADEVTMEESISNEASKKKKSDYVFRLYGVPKFVVEAKAVKVDINSEIFREQAVGYTYNLACSWAVLTNFVQTRVYFVDKNDDTSIISIDNLSDLSKFDENFERLWLLSKEAAKNSLLEERIKGMGIKPEKEKVFKQLFIDLKEWRGKLSNEIRRKYPTYQDYEIEEVVQRIIDRLIFIRKMEDLEIEERKLDQVARKINEGDGYVTYRQLKKVFEYYMEKYNSGLFGEEGKEQACDTVDIQDSVIKAVIQGMYTPTGRRVEYNFAAISGDVLGNIYEEYLSYILKLKENQKKTKLEGGQAHKKEQGIYYTPTYIVDYIVKNSVVEYIKNKSIDEIIETTILDPACGSGSFLIRAFSEVCKTVDANMKKGEISKKSPSLNNYSGRLTLPQKTTILLACIYGVDLDKKAVEIAQLNLFLKLLEGETAETISKLKNTKKILPALNKNILVGNSLIDDEKVAGDLAFKWDERFKDIMARGGFDIVVGNPPYFNIRTNLELQKFCELRYPEIYAGQNDVIYYFVLKGLNVLKNQGNLGYIISRYFLESDSAKRIREYMLDNSKIKEIIDFGNNQVFDGANILTAIITLQKESASDKNELRIVKLKDEQKPELIENINRRANHEFCEIVNIKQSELSSDIWTFHNRKISAIIEKIEKDSITLSIIAKTGAGIQSGLNEVYVVNKDIVSTYNLESSALRNYAKTRDIKPYRIINRNLKVIKLLNNDNLDDLPNIKKYLLQFQDALKKRYEAKKGICKWYAFAVPRNLDIFDSKKEKIVTPIYSTSNKFGYDSGEKSENYLTLSDTAVIQIKDEAHSTKAILSILNSRLMNFYYKQTRKLKRDGYYEYLSKTLESLPIKYNENFKKNVEGLVDNMFSLNKRLSDLGDKKTDERAQIEEELKKTDVEIDALVYDIYGITEEEKKIIEESLK